MKQRVFLFDSERCFGCNGCVAACANANGTPPGLLWRLLLKLPPEDGDLATQHLSLSCNHCTDAPCVRGCPAKALEKREGDGVVIHHGDRCIGCRYCQMACPYGAIRWDEEQQLVSKCQFCHERVDEGRDPACVETCFAGALLQVVVEIPVELTERVAENPAGELAGEFAEKLTRELALYELEAPGFVHIEAVAPNIRFIHRSTAERPARLRPFPPAVPATVKEEVGAAGSKPGDAAITDGVDSVGTERGDAAGEGMEP